MDLSELRAGVFAELGEDPAHQKFWTNDDVNTAINSGYEEIADLTEWHETSRTVTITPPTRYTSLFSAVAATGVIQTSQILSIVKVYDSTRRVWLEPISPALLDAANPTWELARGAPYYYMVRGAFWFGVWPFPNTTSSYTVYTREVPYGATVDTVPLSADGDTPGFPADWHGALVDYAVYDLLCQEGEYDKAMSYYKSFMDASVRLKNWTGNRGAYPMIRVLGGDGLWLG